MGLGAVIALVLLAVLVLGALQLAVMAWRVMRGDDQIEPGGSWGKQMFGRRRDSR